MRARGWRGVTRGRAVRTTVADPAHSRAPDLVKRDFTAGRPGQLHVADFTYVPLDGGGFGYTAFVIDAFAGLIAGWECSLYKETAFVERAVRQAAAWRARQGHPVGKGAIHHSDAGSQYTSVRFAQALLLAGLTPRSAPSGTPWTTRWRRRRSGCTRPSAPGPGHRSAPALSGRWLTWRRSPAPGCTGITPPGSCTGWAAGPRPKPRPGTTSRQRTPHERGPVRTREEGGGFAAAHRPARRAGYGAAPPASRALRVSSGNGLRPPLTPETSAAPGGRNSGQAQSLPRPVAQRRPAVAGGCADPNAREQSELVFDNQKKGKLQIQAGLQAR